MAYQGSYSLIFSESKSTFGEIGVRIIDYEEFTKFIEDTPIKGLKPHLTEKLVEFEQNQPVKEYYLNGLHSATDPVPGPVGYVIGDLCYCHFRKEFLEFWSKLSKFTEPFSFKHSDRGYEENDYEYVVSCDKGLVTVCGLRKRKADELEIIEEYTPID